MKKLIFLLLLIPIIGLAQDGGYRSLKTKSSKIVHSDIINDNNVLIRLDLNGNEKKTFIDNNTIYLSGDTLKSKHINTNTQTLSGTNVTWNMSLGQNAKITLTGNTIIAISNLISGMEGSVTVTNAATTYSLSFSGYVNKIHDSVYSSANTVQTSGGSKIDSYSFRYDGTYVIWNGGKYYH